MLTDNLTSIFDHEGFREKLEWVEAHSNVGKLPPEAEEIRPMKHFITVVLQEPDDRTDGGIWIPEDARMSSGLCWPIVVGPFVGVGDARYEPFWDPPARQVWEVEELRALQRELLGRCYITGLASFREIHTDYYRPNQQTKIGLIHAADIWAEIRQMSYQPPSIGG